MSRQCCLRQMLTRTPPPPLTNTSKRLRGMFGHATSMTQLLSSNLFASTITVSFILIRNPVTMHTEHRNGVRIAFCVLSAIVVVQIIRAHTRTCSALEFAALYSGFAALLLGVVALKCLRIRTSFIVVSVQIVGHLSGCIATQQAAVSAFELCDSIQATV